MDGRVHVDVCAYILGRPKIACKKKKFEICFSTRLPLFHLIIGPCVQKIGQIGVYLVGATY